MFLACFPPWHQHRRQDFTSPVFFSICWNSIQTLVLITIIKCVFGRQTSAIDSTILVLLGTWYVMCEVETSRLVDRVATCSWRKARISCSPWGTYLMAVEQSPVGLRNDVPFGSVKTLTEQTRRKNFWNCHTFNPRRPGTLTVVKKTPDWWTVFGSNRSWSNPVTWEKLKRLEKATSKTWNSYNAIFIRENKLSYEKIFWKEWVGRGIACHPVTELAIIRQWRPHAVPHPVVLGAVGPCMCMWWRCDVLTWEH